MELLTMTQEIVQAFLLIFVAEMGIRLKFLRWHLPQDFQ